MSGDILALFLAVMRTANILMHPISFAAH